MKKIYFKTNGPLLSTFDDKTNNSLFSNSSVYIERDTDEIACTCIRRREYMTLVEPRQQGKTSLINRLMKIFVPQGYAFAYIDLSIMDKSDEASWYHSIYTIILRKLHTHTKLLATLSLEEKSFTHPTNGNTWFEFLRCIAAYGEKINIVIIIVLDEVGATPANWSTNFFSAIRSTFVQRMDTQCLYHLNFIVAGAFDPRLLIRDPVISNFNISRRVILPDFTLTHIKHLVKSFGLFAKQTLLLAEAIYSWTNGQPHLTQCICEELVRLNISRKSENIAEIVDLAVQQFLHGDRQHIAHIRDSLTGELNSTQEYVKRIWLNRHHPRFDPANNHIQARLTLIGIIKAGSDGNCVIRNRLYEITLANMYSDTTSTALEVQNMQVNSKDQSLISIKPINIFFSYSHKDKNWLHKLQEHLAILKRQGLINDWYDRDIGAGADWEEEIKNHINTAHIIIMLISSSFIESEYCYSKEMNYALAQNRNIGTRIIPIIIRPVLHWDQTPLGKFNALPANGKAITTGNNTDKTLVDIVSELQKIIIELKP